VGYPVPAMGTLWDDVRGTSRVSREGLPQLGGRVADAASGARGRGRLLPRDGGRRRPELDRWIERRESARRRVARFIGAEPSEIAFVPNTSTGMNLIADLLEADGPVLSDELEFPAVTLPWIHRGVLVRFVPAVEGVLRLESFAEGQARAPGRSRSATCSTRTVVARTSKPSVASRGTGAWS